MVSVPGKGATLFFSDMWINGAFRVILLTRPESYPGTGWVGSQLLFSPIVVLLYFSDRSGRYSSRGEV